VRLVQLVPFHSEVLEPAARVLQISTQAQAGVHTVPLVVQIVETAKRVKRVPLDFLQLLGGRASRVLLDTHPTPETARVQHVLLTRHQMVKEVPVFHVQQDNTHLQVAYAVLARMGLVRQPEALVPRAPLDTRHRQGARVQNVLLVS